ncbi:MAG: hypothetical protein JMDDDDMK_01114 [Acidobacteria bacterium]|nr:hypothetical protein [Acidobacteriota bacterium]
MKPITREWVNKAEEDWEAARTLARKRKNPAHNAVCFHAQQSAEKYLKARLEEANIQIVKTHDLEALLYLALPVESGWNVLLAELKFLSDFAVDYRYPGAAATKADAQEAIRACRHVRKVIRTSFGLPV